jgi:DNA adenine methylase
MATTMMRPSPDATWEDALPFIERLKGRTQLFTYVDPPYVIKGSSLYENHYGANDHRAIATSLRANALKDWVVSYDDCPLVRELYTGLASKTYSLNYSAHRHHRGTEVVILGPELRPPHYGSPLDAARAKVSLARPEVPSRG